jgi:hypothetical protein
MVQPVRRMILKNNRKKISSPSNRWEVGSEFHWMGLPPEPLLPWPDAATWYLLGRHALVGLLRFLPLGSRRLWLPSYFCFDVAEYWQSFIQVATYSDDPLRAVPDWSTLCPGPTDIVVAVNYFGVRSGDGWHKWREQTDCVLVEDHSHDPASPWARRSNADYAFASLRKTLPVPDGAILWSPRAFPLPEGGTSESAASAIKLGAMIWKREYIEGSSTPDAKLKFRAWQQGGELEFNTSDVAFATAFSQQYLGVGVPVKWRRQRAANTRRLLSKLSRTTQFRPIFSDWPQDAAPFGAVFEFDSKTKRDDARHKLQEHRVYCPVHWPPTASCDSAYVDLANRLLTIPSDQRYTVRDMDKIVSFVTDL